LALTVDRDTPYFRNNGNLSTAYSYVMAERGGFDDLSPESLKAPRYMSISSLLATK